MLSVSNEFKNYLFDTVIDDKGIEKRKNSTIQWEYTVDIDGVGEYTGTKIKSINITGELQKEFTLGSSLSKSMDLDLLVSEKTPIKEDSSINVTLTLLIPIVDDKGYPVLDDKGKPTFNRDNKVKLGTFYTTEVDRQTIGMLKIKAIDAMGHTSKLDSLVDMIFPDTWTTASQLVGGIAAALKLGFDPSKNPELYNYTVGTFKIVVPEFSYRQMLEYLAGFCGCNVRITNEEYIEFFRFEDTGITLKKAHYYNMSKGQYLFKPTALACTIGDTTPVIGEGKDSSTIKFTNPYMTEEQLRKLKPIFCDGGIEYYAINANIIGTGIFEPGDIVTIIDHYDEPQKIYIQDYKLSCSNGVKETLDSHFEYNKGTIANSISGKINQLSTSLKQYVSENFVSTNDFDITIKDMNENIQYAHDGLNKWLIEYYKLEADYDKEGNVLDRDYDLLAIKGKDYDRCELIDDGPTLDSTRLYNDSHTLCRYFTGVYIKDGDNLFKNVIVNVSEGVNVYINGTNIIKRADSKREYPVTLQAGWNTVELITGAKPNTLTALSISFKLKYEYAEEDAVDPFYHLTATMTQEEKDAEEEKKKEENNGGNEDNTPTEPDTGGDDNTEGGENTGGGGTDEELNPASDDEVVEEDKKEELEVTYKRFDFIRLVNAYLIDINYKRVTEVERLTTADSIIDRVSKHTYTDAEGNEFTGGDLLLQGSQVIQTVNEISSTVEEYKKTAEGTEEKISEVTQTLDEYKISFTTAKYGNYFSNSSFGTDDPLTGFNYCLPTAKGKEDHVFTLRTDTEIAVGREPESVTVDKHDVDKYGHLKYTISAYNDGAFQGVVPNDDENCFPTSSRTLSMGQAFKISQTFFKEDEHFPYYKDNETGDYYQFYISMKAKRSESCLYEIGDRLHIYPRLSVSLVIDHDPIIVGEEGNEEEVTRTVINNLVGQPSENEGIVEYGELLDLDVLPNLENYEIDTEWKMIEYFIDLPKERMDQIKVKSFSVIMETQYWTSVNKNYVIYQRNGFHLIRDIDEVKINEEVVPSIYICEPMFATTKDYLSVNYTNKQSEIITGVTNITQDGIQISRSDSELSTEIKNSGMAILYDGEMVAQFKEKTIIPELDVTKKLMAPNVFHNTTNIPDTIYIGEEFANDSDCGKGPTAELMPKYVYFNHLNQSLDRYGIIQLDRLKIVIKKNVDADGNIKKIFPDNTTGSDTPNCFMLDNLKCGVIEIYLEEGVVLNHPIVIKNIDGTVKVRGPIEKEWITLNTEYIIGSGDKGPAPVVSNIIAHNTKWIEIWGLNFTGGRDFPSFNYRTGEYRDDKLFPGETFKSYGELYTKKFDKLIFPFTSLYAYSTLEELNDIINKVAIFIGYCWCGDVSRCNFPNTGKLNVFNNTNSTNYSVGVYGDHCDCYLFNNQGIVGKYYLNRNKCWFRLPIDSFKPQEDGDVDINHKIPNEEIGNWGKDTTNNNPGTNDVPSILGGDGITVIDLMDGIWPGGMIRKGKTNGRAVDHCFLGKSRDLAYLGSFLYDSAPKDTYDPSISTLGSNLTGYSRVKQNINLKGLKTLYNNTDGYFFGSGSTLPSVSYSPEDVSVAAYNVEPEYKHTSLMNGLGLSIAMPDIASALGENRELNGAKLKLEFETINGKLVEYGNQNAFSNTSDNNISTYGGGVVATDNKGLCFGLRFVYDESHHDANGEMRMGYYNMGTCLRGHEILASGKAINSWAISGAGSINSTQNFTHSGGMYGLSFPFVVGLNPFTNDGVLTTEMEIPLDEVDYDWFDPGYITKYTEQYMNLESGYVDKESFFNTLKGLATSSIKYIDIVPVGIWDCMNGASDYPSMDYYSHFSYDITDDQNAYIGLATSCFKLKAAQLILDISTNETPPEPEINTYRINITYRTDSTVLKTETIKLQEGESYDVTENINKANFDGYIYSKTEGNVSGTATGSINITVYYIEIPDVKFDVEPTAWCVVSDTEVGNGSSFRLDSPINASGGFTNGKLFLGSLEKTNTNTIAGEFDVWRTINGAYVSTCYTGGDVGTGISYYDFYTEGNTGTGIQLQFDWDKVFTALVNNPNGAIKLNLEFENKTYGTENTPIYFHIRLLFGELCSNKDKYHTMLDYSRTMIEFEKTGKDVFCLYGGDTDYWNRYKDSNPFNPSSSTCWSASAGSTFSIDIGSFTGLTSTTFKTSAQGTYTYHIKLGSTWPVNPDHMANIRTAIRNKTLSAIQLIPIDRSYVYNNGYTPSRNCLRLTSASITIQ